MADNKASTASTAPTGQYAVRVYDYGCTPHWHFYSGNPEDIRAYAAIEHRISDGHDTKPIPIVFTPITPEMVRALKERVEKEEKEKETARLREQLARLDKERQQLQAKLDRNIGIAS